jgi:tetratricopeptide (TPR) repeat protein
MDVKAVLVQVKYFSEQALYQQSEELLTSVLAVEPNNHEALYYRGFNAYHCQKLSEARELFSQALQHKATDLYHFMLGNVLVEQHQYQEAEAQYHQAIALNPAYVDAYSNLGVALKNQQRETEAIVQYQKALALDSNHCGAYCNLGLSLKSQGQISEAIASYQQALALNPNHVVSHYNLGLAYEELRDLDKTLACYLTVVALNPRYTRVYLNLGLVYLMRKNFTEGWKYYEWRLKDKIITPPALKKKPKWGGESLVGKVIYVYHEQGLGDTLQFCRFLPQLKQLGAKQVLFKCQQGLEGLLATSLPEVDIVHAATPDEWLSFDIQCHLMSLPHLLNLTYQDLPNPALPYLRADINKVVAYQQRYFNTPKMKIGLFWQGSPTHKKDKDRSIPFTYFEPLLQLPNVQFYSIQKGVGIEQLYQSAQVDTLVDLGTTFQNFTDTAAAIQNLDLLITVDSAVAHLAGALGKPVWIMVPTSLEFRWFLDERETIWYNNARLFRPPLGTEKQQLITTMYNELLLQTTGKVPQQ